MIKESELILNPDGSVYHLNLRPEHIAQNIIFVGDPDRIEMITQHFDRIEHTTHKREFKTKTGFYRGKRISVVSTGIGSDNIDIVMNELDALVNINLDTRTPKQKHTSLNIVRIGTSGSLQKTIPIDSFLLSTHGLDITGMLQSYNLESITHPEIEKAFIQHTNWSPKKSYPSLIANDSELEEQFSSSKTYKGITATAGGFYGPQGRILRLSLQDPDQNQKIDSFRYKDLFISNLEMETAAIYGMAKLLGHRACSLNAIIANRANGTFSEKPNQIVKDLIQYTLDKFIH